MQAKEQRIDYVNWNEHHGKSLADLTAFFAGHRARFPGTRFRRTRSTFLNGPSRLFVFIVEIPVLCVRIFLYGRCHGTARFGRQQTLVSQTHSFVRRHRSIRDGRDGANHPMQEVKKRQPLYLPEDPSTSVYLLKQGRVRFANTSSNGKEVTFDILEPGEVFGELEVLEDAPRSTSAEMLQPASHRPCLSGTRHWIRDSRGWRQPRRRSSA